MEILHPLPRPTNRTRALSDSLTPRGRVGSDRDMPQKEASSNPIDENRPSTTVPKGLESMLKVKTETGDIGTFSIKPSRIPRGHTTPRRALWRYSHESQKTRQAFQPFNAPDIDDRRRLPSYAHDTTSEVISLDKTANQKSASRSSEGADYRTHSMNQASSYLSYALSNHRSYTSLRSQPDGGGSLQQSRSPFAHPARLRRPGFRPPSPAFTDGDLADYNRHGEIDRMPNGFIYSSSSPASLYAQKRKPPLSLRADGNRSTPSLLSQPSPPRGSSSPFLHQNNSSLKSRESPKNGPTFENTSPTRSTFSVTSTINLYAAIPGLSVISTPRKYPSTSPLYYDYTEDFDIEDCNPQQISAAATKFKSNRSAEEENSDGQDLMALARRDSGSKTDQSSPASSDIRKSMEKSSSSKEGDTKISEDAQGFDNSVEILNTESSTSSHDQKFIHLSGLGYGAQTLSSHIEEAFGLPPSPPSLISTDQNGVQRVKAAVHIIDQLDSDQGKPSKKTPSSCRVINLPGFSPTPNRTAVSNVNATSLKHISPASRTLLPTAVDNEPLLPVSNDIVKRTTSREINEGRFRTTLISASPHLTQFTSIDAGLDDLVDLVRNASDSKIRAPELQELNLIQKRTLITSQTIPDASLSKRVPYLDLIYSSDGSFLRQGQPSTIIEKPRMQSQKRHQRPHNDNKFRPTAILDHGSTGLPDFALQLPRKFVACSERPMLAPKPISPARQLRLKNSIPQLMKALPPLPLEPLVRDFYSPSNETCLEDGLSCRFSSLLPDYMTTAVKALSEASQPAITQSEKPASVRVDELVQEGTDPILDENLQSPTKLRLWMSSSNSLRSISPLSSRPWNFDECYPWSNQEPEIRLPISGTDKLTMNKPPRFKLKVTRATSSTQGTVRINHDSSESYGLNFSNPPDLFTPSRFDNVIQPVNKCLHSRKPNATSYSRSEPLDPSFRKSGEAVDQRSDTSRIPVLSSPSHPIGESETRSIFSDDSSRTQEPYGLRKRFSIFRAQMVVPYASRLGSLSLDDVICRERKNRANRSITNLRSKNPSSESTPTSYMGEKVQTRRLTTRMRAWIHGTRSRIAARIGARGKRRKGSDETMAM